MNASAPMAAKTATPRLDVRGVTRRFDGVTVVDDVSLTVMPGEVTCLLGPSGCGKSTTLRIIAGVERLDAGEVWVDGRKLADTAGAVPPEQRSVGLMFQDYALFPHLTVAENVGFGLSGRSRSAGVAARVAEMLDKVGMARFADAYPHQLSGGEQQRVALARALAPAPRVMLMDEPFSGLDDRLRDGVRDETLDLLRAEGAAVLLVTHEPAEAMRMADQIALMRAGRIVQKGPPFEIYTRPADRETAAFFSDINVIEGDVHAGSVRTPLGAFDAPGLPDGSRAEVVFRLQHLSIDFDRGGVGPAPTPQTGTPAKALVERSRFVGGESIVVFRLDEGGMRLRAKIPAVFLPKPDTLFWLTVRRERCFVFPKAA